MIPMLDRIIYGDVTLLNIITAVLIFAGAVLLSKLFSLNIRRTLRERVAREHLELIVKISSYIIIIIAVLWALPQIGVEPSGLMVAGGIVGLAIGFASQRIVGNLISGLFLIMERPVKIGDNVDIDGVAGFVEDIRVISTTIQTYDGLYVRLPNETVFTSRITNFVSHASRRFEYRVGIRYSDDAEKAIRVIHDTLDQHPFVLVNPPAQAYVDDLADNSVDIVVRAWAPTTEWLAVKTELLWSIKCALEDAGLEIPFPQRVLWYGDKQ